MWTSTGFARDVEGSARANAVRRVIKKRLEASLSSSDKWWPLHKVIEEETVGGVIHNTSLLRLGVIWTLIVAMITVMKHVTKIIHEFTY